jgi:hypothetical protein
VFRDGSLVKTIQVQGTSAVVEDLSTDSSYRFTVTAENKAGKSKVSTQSNEVVPYGTPDPVGRPEASLGSNTNGQADVRWSPTANFRGTGGYYKVQASGLDARDAAASPYTYTGLNNGTSYTFQVQACNEYTCSDWSASSNAVIPYTVPGTPGITYHRSDAKNGYFTVTGPSSNGGRNVDSIEYRLSGSSSDSGTRTSWPFNVNVGNDYDQSFTLQARAHNAAGWSGWSSATGRTDARPAPELWVTSSGVSAGCANERCEYWVINWRNMGPGNHQVACWAGDTSNNDGPRYWHDIHEPHPTTWGGSVKYDISGDTGSQRVSCFMGQSYNGTAVGVHTPDALYKGSTWNIG